MKPPDLNLGQLEALLAALVHSDLPADPWRKKKNHRKYQKLNLCSQYKGLFLFVMLFSFSVKVPFLWKN
jgi:hypothetical protein